MEHVHGTCDAIVNVSQPCAHSPDRLDRGSLTTQHRHDLTSTQNLHSYCQRVPLDVKESKRLGGCARHNKCTCKHPPSRLRMLAPSAAGETALRDERVNRFISSYRRPRPTISALTLSKALVGDLLKGWRLSHDPRWQNVSIQAVERRVQGIRNVAQVVNHDVVERCVHVGD